MPPINSSQKGFSLIEALVAIFILSLTASALVGAIVYSNQVGVTAGTRARAITIAEEGLEAARNIRDAAFGNLTDGAYGLAISGGHWAFSGSSDITDGQFTRQINVETIDAATKKVTSTVTWPQKLGKPGNIQLITYLGNIGLLNSGANCLSVNTSAASIGGGGTRDLLGITLGNGCDIAITVNSLTVSWTNAARSAQQVLINGNTVWTGSAGPGTTLDITNTGIAAGISGVPLTRIRFSGNMAGNSFTIVFTMSDGTSKTITYP